MRCVHVFEGRVRDFGVTQAASFDYGVEGGPGAGVCDVPGVTVGIGVNGEWGLEPVVDCEPCGGPLEVGGGCGSV